MILPIFRCGVGIISVIAVAALPRPATARDYYVDPVMGAESNDGSRMAPRRSVQAVVDKGPLSAGDVIHLLSGDHGPLTIRNVRNRGTVTIAAVPGQTPRLTSIRLIASSNWLLRGLDVMPSSPSGGKPAFIVVVEDGSEHITVEDCSVTSAPDVSSWTDADWRERAYHGISAAGRAITLKANRIRNIKHGIEITAVNSTVELNIIDNFGGDGIRGLGNDTVYQYNTIKNCYRIDDNHDDGFQSWSRGLLGPGTGVVSGGVLRGNLIINYEDPQQPLRGTLQGIGMFDGMYEDWIIENNVIITDHWHGITVMGARNVRVVNNTVLDPNDAPPGPPWISITHHKDGRSPENSVIANNLAAPRAASKNDAFDAFGLPKPGVTALNNLDVRHPDRWFVDARRGDLRLRADSPAIDAGAAEFAPAIDIVGVPRPQGAGVDVGAYEFQRGGDD